MKYTVIDPIIQNRLQAVLKDFSQVQTIAQAIYEQRGRVLLVGGAVRDLYIGLPVKDLDIEVHEMPLEVLENILRTFGPVSTVGKVFGVLRLHHVDVDWSVPRADTSGRKPIVTLDPKMSMQQAFARRDLTINAMGIDLNSFELIDPFHGLEDLKNKILRAPDPAFFVEDPLRFYRVMQFCARFDMQPDAQLNALCAAMNVSSVSKERITEEFAKWLLKSAKPSRGLDWLLKIGRLNDILPEVYALIGVGQEPAWHPEGDVFEHTKQALDAAAVLSYKDTYEKLRVLYAVLCHDLGKVSTTKVIDGVITSRGHAEEGALLAGKLLRRITENKELISAVQKLVRHHMDPVQFVDGGAKLSAYKRLALKLHPEANLQMLADVAIADRRGRNPQKGEPLHESVPVIETFLENARHAHVLEKKEEPVLQGRDLIDVIEPGPEMGALVKRAYEIQIEEGINDKEVLKHRVLEERKCSS